MFIADLFKSRSRLEAENVVLRHQLNVALRRTPSRLLLRGSDRALLVWIVRLWPSLLGAVQVVQPETILRWQRAGFRALWRWKSRNRAGRPRIDRGLPIVNTSVVMIAARDNLGRPRPMASVALYSLSHAGPLHLASEVGQRV
jgi:hypothetical protein